MSKKLGDMSRSARKAYMTSEVDDERFVIDYPSFFFLLLAVVMGTTIAIMGLQHDPLAPLYIVATQINSLLLVGIAVMMVVAFYFTDKGNLRFDVKMMDRKETIEAAVGMFVAFSVARIMSMVIGLTLSKIYGLQLAAPELSGFGFWDQFTITFASAFNEEVLFALGITTGSYIAFYKIIDRATGDEGLARIMASLLAATLAGVFFVQIHIGAYNISDPMIIGFLFAARFIYSFAYLITRNAMVPIGAHILHNATCAI